MIADILNDTMKRVVTWPEDVQEELAAIVLEMDKALKEGGYKPSQEELAGIDRGLQAAQEGRFVEADRVRSVLAKNRPA